MNKDSDLLAMEWVRLTKEIDDLREKLRPIEEQRKEVSREFLRIGGLPPKGVKITERNSVKIKSKAGLTVLKESFPVI